jgi:hypothetical protein
MSGITSIGCRPLTQNNYSSSPKAVTFRGDEDYEYLSESIEESDKPKDKNFNVNNALANLGKGFISPITTMFSSATNFLVGAGTIGVCAGLMSITKNKIGPALVAAGTVYGGIQTALGIKKVIKAENNNEREKAFYDIGAGTGILAASAVVAKPTLEAAGLAPAETESLTITKSALECFKQLPKSFENSVGILNDPAAMSKIVNGVANKEATTSAMESTESGNVARL